MTETGLAGKHLADLHARAAELGVPRYRMLRREELVERIQAAERRESRRGGEKKAGGGLGSILSKLLGRGKEKEAAAKQPKARQPRGGPTRTSSRSGDEPLVTGILHVRRDGYGFLRQGEKPSPDDIYVSASQVRRCELRTGDEVSGPVRPPRQGERYTALVRVELVNGATPPSGPARGSRSRR